MTKAGLQSVTLPGSDEPVELHFHDLRGTTVTLLSEAGCTPQQIAPITGHSLKTVHRILERYLARTSGLAEQAIFNWEKPTANRQCQRRASRKRKLMHDKSLTGAPEAIRTPDPQIRRLTPSIETATDFCKPDTISAIENQKLSPLFANHGTATATQFAPLPSNANSVLSECRRRTTGQSRSDSIAIRFSLTARLGVLRRLWPI
jgi:hypothetical protein